MGCFKERELRLVRYGVKHLDQSPVDYCGPLISRLHTLRCLKLRLISELRCRNVRQHDAELLFY